MKGVREMQENMKCNHIHKIEIAEREEQQGRENLFEKVMMENFPNLMREKSYTNPGNTESQSRGTQTGALEDTS